MVKKAVNHHNYINPFPAQNRKLVFGNRIVSWRNFFCSEAIQQLTAGLRSRSRSRSESEVFGRSRSRNILSDSDSSCPLSLRICDVSRATYAAARTSGVQYSNLFKRTLPRIT